MNLNNLDTAFSKTKTHCIVLFAIFSTLFCAMMIDVLRCNDAILTFANAQHYAELFSDSRVSEFFLGRMILNAMEYVYIGKGFFWILLKSLDVVEVLFVLFFIIIVFQDVQHSSSASLRVFSIVLFALTMILLVIYGIFCLQASIQLTAEAGFSLLRMGALICDYLALGSIVGCLLMNVALCMIRYENN